MKIIVITLFVLIAIGITLKFLFFNNKKKKKEEEEPKEKKIEFTETLNQFDNIVDNMNTRKKKKEHENEISQQNIEGEKNNETKEDNSKIEKEAKDKDFDLKSAIVHKSIFIKRKKKR